MFLKEYSLKVEQWSSKSHVWVRFLLLLLLRLKKFKHNLDFKYKIKIKNLINRKKKNKLSYSNHFSYNSFYYKFKKKFIANGKFLKKTISSKFSLWPISSFNLFKINTSLSIFSIFNKNVITFSDNFYQKYYNTFLQHLHSNTNVIFNKKNLDFYFYFYINNLTIQKTFNNFFNTFFNENISFTNKFSFLNSNRSEVISNSVFNVTFNNNNLLTLNSYFKKNLKFIKLFKLNKFFFMNFSKFSKNISIFKISKQDWISEYVAKITRDSLSLNSNDYLKYKFFHKNLINKKNKILFFFSTLMLKNDLFKEDILFTNNYDYINFNDSFLNNSTNVSQNYVNINLILQNNIKFLEFNKFNSFNFFNFSLLSHSPIETLIFFLFNPIFYKFSLLNNDNALEDSSTNYKKNLFNNFNKIYLSIKENFLYSNKNSILLNNIIPLPSFYYILKKKILKVFSYNKFPTITSIWHYSVFIKFLEFFTSRKVYFKVFGFIQNKLDNQEKAQCLLWAQKVKYFRKVLGPRLFLNESLQILYLALKLKDPFLLSNWMVATMQKISFWKYKTFLRYLKYVLRYFFWVIFRELKIKGIKFQLKGKISVAGNARTRTVFHTVGFTSHTTFNNKILYKLNLVKTFTGVLGLKLWIVF